jgi:hypothetical protein
MGGHWTHLMPFSFAHSTNAAVRLDLEAVDAPPPPPPSPPPPLSADDDAVAASTAADNDGNVDDDDGRGGGGGRRGRRRSTTVGAAPATALVAGDDDAMRDGATMPANDAAAASPHSATRADIIHARRCGVARLLVENRTMLNSVTRS